MTFFLFPNATSSENPQDFRQLSMPQINNLHASPELDFFDDLINVLKRRKNNSSSWKKHQFNRPFTLILPKKKRLTSENMLISGRSPRSFCSTLENSNLQGIFESSDSVWCFPFSRDCPGANDMEATTSSRPKLWDPKISDKLARKVQVHSFFQFFDLIS